MTDNDGNIWNEPYKGLKVKDYLAAVALIVGSALTILGVAYGLREGFHGNYIKLFAGVFLMVLPIDVVIRSTNESIRKNKEKEAFRKEIEKAFDTPEKKINAPTVASKSDRTTLYSILLLMSIFFFFVSIGAIIAGFFLTMDYSDGYAELFIRVGAISMLGCFVLFVLSLLLFAYA